MKILVSGFEVFDAIEENPSQQLIQHLNSKNSSDIKAIVLPVVFNKAFEILKKEIDLFRPDFVIATGLAFVRSEITPERIAINLIDARIPDNEGNQPQGTTVIEGHSDGLFSSLPVKAMAQSVLDIGVKASVSNSAGTYICNSLMYRLLHYSQDKNFKAGFVHLPPTPAIKKGDSTMELQDIFRGFEQMLTVIYQAEIKGSSFCTES